MLIPQTNSCNLKIVGYALVTILLLSCGQLQIDMGQLPPGMAYLNQAPGGHNFDAFLEESSVKSELFRRRLLAGGDPNFISADLIAEAIMKFRQQAPYY